MSGPMQVCTDLHAYIALHIHLMTLLVGVHTSLQLYPLVVFPAGLLQLPQHTTTSVLGLGQT